MPIILAQAGTSVQDTLNLVSIAATVALGVVSIVLGGFAIWLSLHFDKRSSATLDSIRDLAGHTKELVNEVKSVTNVGISQQKDFSSKMLESILSRSQYGRPDLGTEQEGSELEQMIRHHLEETEHRIADVVETKVRSLSAARDTSPKELQETVDLIRAEIRKLGDKAASAVASPLTLPSELQQALVRWISVPAFYVLINGIVRANAGSVEDLKKAQPMYKFPVGWEGAIQTLLERKILTGTKDKFEITSDFKAPLTAWLDVNEQVILRLIDGFNKRAEKTPSKDVKLIATDLKF